MTANGMQAHRTGSYSRADIINTDTHCYEYLKVFNSLLQQTHLDTDNRHCRWPDHCVQSEFGSRFSPYLKIPSSAVIVKKGYQDEYDAYSAFGGTLSAQSSPFDTADTETDLIHNADLKALIEQYEIDRFWYVQSCVIVS